MPPVTRASSSAVISPGRASRCTDGAGVVGGQRLVELAASPPSASANACAIHRGWAWANAVWPSGSSTASGASCCTHAFSSRSPTRRSTALTNPAARLPASTRTSSTVVSTAACGGTRVRSSW